MTSVTMTPMSSQEAWVPGYLGRYTVDRQGRVFAAPRPITLGYGARRMLERHEMKPSPGNDHGHLKVRLTGDDGQTRNHWVHRLVAETFIPNPEGHPYVLHGPNGTRDNSADNLSWGTALDNSRDRERDGTVPVYVPPTHCRAGHEMTDDNVYVPPKRPNERRCKTCQRANSRRWKEKETC